jgi:hypothetical protein
MEKWKVINVIKVNVNSGPNFVQIFSAIIARCLNRHCCCT